MMYILDSNICIRLFNLLYIDITILSHNFMIHFSCKEIPELKSVYQKDAIFKPRGLWYSTDDLWIQYYTKNINKINNCKYMYRLKLKYTSFDHPNKNRILKLTDETSFDLFTLKYGIVYHNDILPGTFTIYIKWEDVAKDYGGIEVIPLIKERININDKKIVKKYNKKFKFIKKLDNNAIIFWQYPFDIPSGCVWNPNAISKFVRTYKI